MKKKLALLNIGLCVLLSGCGNSTNVIEGEVKTIATGEVSTQSGAEADRTEEKQSGQQAEQAKGYVFTYDGTVIAVDAEAAPVIEQLGDANSYFEAPSCAFEGIDKIYTYNSFEIDTYPLKDQDHISEIIFKDDTVATPEGIGIGDSVDKVTETYGDDGTDENGMMVYEKDGMKLCFIIKENCVASVEYRSTVLD